MYDKQIASVETSFQTIGTITNAEEKRQVSFLV